MLEGETRRKAWFRVIAQTVEKLFQIGTEKSNVEKFGQDFDSVEIVFFKYETNIL